MRLLNTMVVNTSCAAPQNVDQISNDDPGPLTSQTTVRAKRLLDRTDVVVPISPQNKPNDLLLYQDPKRADQFYYLPRYELDFEQVSGKSRYRVAFKELNGHWSLTLYLTKFRAPELESSDLSASELNHSFQATLRFTRAGRVESWPFDEQEDTEFGKRISMRINSVEDRDKIFSAMSDAQYSCSLRIARGIEVAIATEVAEPPADLPKNYSVQMTKLGTNKISVIKAVRMWSGLSLAQSKQLVERRPPIILAKKLNKQRATAFVKDLRLAGAKASVLGSRDGSPPRPVKQRFDIWLEHFGGQKKQVIRLISEYSTLSRQQITRLLSKPLPVRVLRGFSSTNTKKLTRELRAIGAKVALKKTIFKTPIRNHRPPLDRIVIRSEESSAGINVSTLTKYQIVRTVIDHQVSPTPFLFDLRLHDYIYQFIEGPVVGGLLRHQLQFEGQFYTYLVDSERRNVVYFLPDEFKVARWDDDTAFYPRMSVKVNSRDDGSGLADVTLSYLAVPVVNQKRIDTAATKLSIELDIDSTELKFQPYPVMDYSFKISHPTETGVKRVELDVSSNLFYEGIQTTLVMPLSDFVPCYSAMIGQTTPSLHGTVTVELPDSDKVRLPFNGNLDDLAGELFDYVAIEDQDGRVSTTLINAIESPLEVRALDATLSRDNTSTDATLVSEHTFPLILPPGDSLAITLQGASSLEGSGPIQAHFDLDQVDVQLDQEALWDTILNRSATDYFRTVTAIAVDSTFAAVAGREDQQIISVLVHIEGGGSVLLNKDTLQGEIKIDYAVDDLILRQQISASYQYYYEVARRSGEVEVIEGGETNREQFFVGIAA